MEQQQRWYYARGGRMAGPITASDLLALVDAGRLGPDDRVCREGTDRWVTVSSLRYRPRDPGRPGSPSPKAATPALAVDESTPLHPTDAGPGAVGVENPSPGRSDTAEATRRPLVDTVLTVVVLLSVAWYVAGVGLDLAAGVWLELPAAGMLLVGAAWVALGARYAATGMAETWRGCYQRLQSHVAAGVLVILFGAAIFANGVRSAVASPPPPTDQQVRAHLLAEITTQLGRAPDLLMLRPVGDGTFVGTARLGRDTWEVTVDGRTLAWTMRARQEPERDGLKQDLPKGLPERTREGPVAQYTCDPAAVPAYRGRGGTFSLHLPPGEWTQIEQPGGPVPEAAFQHRSGDAVAAVIHEKAPADPESLVSRALANMRQRAAAVDVVLEERRRVNGVELVCLIAAVKVDGQELTYCSYYHAGKSGTLQLVTWTSTSRFGERKSDLEKFLNGLVITGESH